MATRQLAVVPAANGPSELVSFLRARLAVQQDLLGRLDRLAPPAADIAASLLKPFQRAVVRQQQLLPDIARAISHGDDVQLANLHTDFDLAAHPRSVAAFVRFYGFTMCGSFDYFHTP